MKGLPAELVYFLIFAAIVLFQLMTRRSRQRAQQESAQDERLPEFLEEETEEMEPPAATPVSSVTTGHFGRPGASMASPAPARRRFSRGSLMGTGRDVQNAVVIAAILGPCRAFEPHDVR